MERSLYPNQVVVVNRGYYMLSDPKPNDVIVFYNQQLKKRAKLIKRVVGIEGDTVRICNGDVWINNKRFCCDSTIGKTLVVDIPKHETDTILIPQNKLFCLGDNRNNSIDSRYDEIGLIDKNQIVGKVIFCFPLSWCQ